MLRDDWRRRREGDVGRSGIPGNARSLDENALVVGAGGGQKEQGEKWVSYPAKTLGCGENLRLVL